MMVSQKVKYKRGWLYTKYRNWSTQFRIIDLCYRFCLIIWMNGIKGF